MVNSGLQSKACNSEHLDKEVTAISKIVFQDHKIRGQSSGGSKSFSIRAESTVCKSHLGITLCTGGRKFRLPCKNLEI